jgi:hypothetical protein
MIGGSTISCSTYIAARIIFPVRRRKADWCVNVVIINLTGFERLHGLVTCPAVGRAKVAELGDLSPDLIGHHPMVPQKLVVALSVLVAIKKWVANLQNP